MFPKNHRTLCTVSSKWVLDDSIEREHLRDFLMIIFKPGVLCTCHLCVRVRSRPRLARGEGRPCPTVSRPAAQGFRYLGAPAFPWDSLPCGSRGLGRRSPKLEATLGRARWPCGWSRTKRRLLCHKRSN